MSECRSLPRLEVLPTDERKSLGQTATILVGARFRGRFDEMKPHPSAVLYHPILMSEPRQYSRSNGVQCNVIQRKVAELKGRKWFLRSILHRSEVPSTRHNVKMEGRFALPQATGGTF